MVIRRALGEKETLREKRDTELAADLRITQEATPVSHQAPPCPCGCKGPLQLPHQGTRFFLLHVAEKLQKLGESKRHQAQRSASERGAR